MRTYTADEVDEMIGRALAREREKQAEQAQPVAWRADVQKVRDALDPDDWCGDERMIDVLDRVLKPCCGNMVAGTSCFADPRPNCPFLTPPPRQPEHPDDEAVDHFAAAMKAKMAKQRAKGYGGWDDPAACPTERLQTMLVDHVDKGDPVDVGNFAMMLFNRGEQTAQPPRQPWAGLTDEEVINAMPDDDTPISLGEAFSIFADLIEAKLKEKNT